MTHTCHGGYATIGNGVASIYQIPWPTNLFIEPLYMLPNLKVCPASVIQCVQAHLLPEDTRHVKDIMPEHDVPAQHKELASESHCIMLQEC